MTCKPLKSAVVVSGVSSGIGLAVARDLCARGFHVFGTVRREVDAARLHQELAPNFTPLFLDITDQGAILAAAKTAHDALAGATIFGLVNNAGAGGGGPLMHQDPAELMSAFHNLAVGPVMMAQAFLPMLGARRGFKGPPGRIVNITSVGGRIAFPFLGSYVAGKHALEALSDCLRRELLLYGIDLIIVEPGATKTAIWQKAVAEENPRYTETDYGPSYGAFIREFSEEGQSGLDPARVARIVHSALTVRRPRTRYAVVPKRLLNWSLPRLLPDRAVDIIFARRLGLKRN